jgi:uncharacterized SAM-binding protein YcdF (DUF218 family)
LKVLRVFVGLIVLVVSGWLFVFAAVYLYGRRDDARRADAVVVLGAAQYDGRPSPVLRARLDHAIRLYHDGIAPRMITTGGVGPGDTVSEAVVGRRYAIRHGVPADAILTERSGLGTAESLAAVARLMRDGEMESAVLVSDPFHMLRLRLLAARFGIRAHSSPTRTSPISGKSDEEWRHVLRESLVLPFALLERP